MSDSSLDQQMAQAKEALDAHVRKSVEWHFNPETGCDYWLEKAKGLDFDPREEIKCFEDVKKFPLFEDDDLRGDILDQPRCEVTRQRRRTNGLNE